MVGLLHKQHAMSDRFISHMLARNIRIEEDLIDQLFNSSEKRLARALLLLARYGKQDKPARVVPKISQETLAEMIGTTRSRVNFFLNKFKRLGFIEYDGETAGQDQQLAAQRRPARLNRPHQSGSTLGAGLPAGITGGAGLQTRPSSSGLKTRRYATTAPAPSVRSEHPTPRHSKPTVSTSRQTAPGRPSCHRPRAR